MNMQQMLAQAQKMKKELEKQKTEFEKKEFEYDYKNKSIVVTITGGLKIKKIKINPVLVDPEDIETLQDMVAEAIDESIDVVKQQKDAIISPELSGLF